MSTPCIVPDRSSVLLPAQGQAAGGKRQGAPLLDTARVEGMSGAAAGEKDAFPDLLARMAPAGETGADLAVRGMPLDAGVESTFSGMLSRLAPAGETFAGAAARTVTPDAAPDTTFPGRLTLAVEIGAPGTLSGSTSPMRGGAMRGGHFPEMLSRLAPAHPPAAPSAASAEPPTLPADGTQKTPAASGAAGVRLPATAAPPPPRPLELPVSLHAPVAKLPDWKPAGENPAAVTAVSQGGAVELPPATAPAAAPPPETPAISELIRSLTCVSQSSGTQTGAGLVMSPKAAPAALPQMPAPPMEAVEAAVELSPLPIPVPVNTGESEDLPLPASPEESGGTRDTPPSQPEAAAAVSPGLAMPSWPGMAPAMAPPPMADPPAGEPPQSELPSQLPLSAERLALQTAAPRTDIKVLHQETHFAPVRPHTIKTPASYAAPVDAVFDDGAGPAAPAVTEAAPAEPAVQAESAPPAPQREPGGLIETQAPAMGETSATPPLPQQPPARQLSDRIAVELAAPASAPETPAGGTHPATVIRTLTIQLEPADLGTLTVHLSIKNDGLEVHVEASRRETARMIEDDQKTLSHLLQSAGYRVDALAVQVSDAARTGAAPQAQANPGAQSSGQQQQGSSQTGGQSPGSPQHQERDGSAQHETRSGNSHDKANADRLGGDVYV